MRKTSLGILTMTVLLICAYVFAMFQGGFVSWFLFFSFLPFALCTFLWYLLWFKGLEVERMIEKEKAIAGEMLRVRIKVKNPYRLPYAYLFLKDHMNARFLKQKDKFSIVSYPWFKQEMEVEYQIASLPRGVIRFEQLSLQTGDLFGFIQKEKAYKQEQEVVVYPRYEEIYGWQTWNERNSGSTHTLTKHIEDMSSVMGVRDYVPGDRLARIHWKASARSPNLKTKEFEQQVTNDFMFFLDREQVAYPLQDVSLFELGVSLTASLVKYALDHRFSCGLVSYGEHDVELIPMSREQAQVYRIFEHLARVEADAKTPFVENVMQQVSYLPIGTTIVIISAQLDQKLVTMLAELSYRQKKVEFFWLKGTAPITLSVQHFLHVLQKERVVCQIIEDNRFNQALSKGGAGSNAFANSNPS